MSDVNLQFVREFFELNMFNVLTNWHQAEGLGGAGEQNFQFFATNTVQLDETEVNFVLKPGDIQKISRAAIEIRAWHNDRFYPSVIESSRILKQLTEESPHQRAREIFGADDFATIVVISELPKSHEPREKSIDLLKKLGADHIIEFSSILQDLLNRVSVNVDYAASQTLKTLSLLKRYDFIRNSQMEFTFPTEAPSPALQPIVETVEVTADEDAEDDQQ